jgi:hypothetical protein
MLIEIVGEGHRLAGTPRQILMQMKSLTRGAERMTLREYVEANLANIARGSAFGLKVADVDDEELAESFLQSMLESGFARRL